MKKRLLSAFLAVMMVLTMAPVAFAADDDGVTSYDALTTAISSANSGDTIKLANDITLTNTLTIDKNITLDGQGHTISGTVSSGSFISVQIPNDGDFTMTNCVIVPSGMVNPNAAINLSVNGKVSVTNCKFGSESDTAGYMYNGLEFSQTYAMGDTNITGNTFYGGAFRHNCISFYKMVENANINISNNNFVDLNWDNTNAIRVSNYSSANATITLNGNSYSTHGSDANKNYEGLLFFQITSNNDDLTKLNVVVNDLKTDFDGQLYYTYKDGVGLTSENEAVIHGDDSIAKYFVAKIGDTYYKTLTDAITAAQDNDTVTLLKDTSTTEGIVLTTNITLDLNGKTWTGITSGVAATLTVKGANLTIKDSSADESGKITANEYGIAAFNGAKITVQSGTIEANYAALSGNNTAGDMNFEVNGGTLTSKKSEAIYMPGQVSLVVNDGTINGGISTRMGQITVNGGTINGMTGDTDSIADYYHHSGSAWIGDAIYVWAGTYNSSNTEYGNSCNITINNGVINGKNQYGVAVYKIGTGKEQTVNVNIKNGKISGQKGAVAVVDSGFTHTNCPSDSTLPHVAADPSKVTSNVVISGGLFSAEFDKSFCAAGLTIIGNTDESTKDEYSKTVGTITAANQNEIDTASEVGNAQASVTGVTGSENIKAAEKVASSVKPTEAPAESTQITDADKTAAVTALVNEGYLQLTTDNKIPDGTDVTVVKKIYFDVELTGLDMNNGTTNPSVTMDITPKYDLVAVSEKDTTKNEVVLKSNLDANVDKATISVVLPTNFVSDINTKVYVLHTKNGTKYVYDAKITQNGADYVATFTNPHGFSEFKLVTTLPVATITKNGVTTSYDSLQAAADAAANGDTIVVNSGASHDLTFTTTKSVKVTNKTNDKITVKFNGTNKDVAKDKTETFSYTKPSSSSGSSSGKTTFKVVTSSVNNGGVNASPSSAEKGATITITLSPDKGYKLGTLTVTDGSGKTIATTKKSDTVYTFTMPASQVKVGVTYVKADTTVTPSTGFNDVASGDWFADAVKYVVDKNMMNGTGTNTFAPKANTTRGMIVTVLYRLENEPNTSAASFTDVAAGQYYANAVAWANANGIVSGYGNGKFGPNDKITREQLAAILYRYAQYKKYDVSVGENTNILSYEDVQSVSSYAMSAVQWACGAGVVTGKTGGKLDPKGNATRAEVAAMLMRFCENVAK